MPGSPSHPNTQPPRNARRCRDRRAGRDADRGQAAVFVVLVAVAMFAVVVTGLTTLGRRVVDRARAQSAADAAALASVDGGRAPAAELAAAAGGSVASWERLADGTVVVTVRLGGISATASASSAP